MCVYIGIDSIGAPLLIEFFPDWAAEGTLKKRGGWVGAPSAANSPQSKLCLFWTQAAIYFRGASRRALVRKPRSTT